MELDIGQCLVETKVAKVMSREEMMRSFKSQWSKEERTAKSLMAQYPSVSMMATCQLIQNAMPTFRHPPRPARMASPPRRSQDCKFDSAVKGSIQYVRSTEQLCHRGMVSSTCYKK